MSAPHLPLAADFERADEAAWRRLAAKALAAAERDPARRTHDGLRVEPLYTGAAAGELAARAGLPGAAPWLRGARAVEAARAWDVRQRHAHPDPPTANRQILEDLERGVTSITLRVAARLEPIDGCAALDVADLDRALDGVLLDVAPVALEAGARGVEAAAAFLALLERRHLAPDAARASLGVDPFGAALAGAPLDLQPAAALAAHVARHRPSLTTLLADGRPWHAAGGSEAQELAATLAAGVAYLRALETAGLDPADGARRIAFALAADAEVFATVAKLRALRGLWGRVLEASGAAAAMASFRLHAETATRMYARRDPHVNILRGTVAAFAAAAGGADSIAVLPFDHAQGLPGAFSRRIARDVQLVLLEESQLHRVADPAGGSWYVESLTDGLMREAWCLFQAIEGAGGMAEALGAGLPQIWVAATWAERRHRVATRTEPVTGVSEFPLLAEPDHETEPFDAGPIAARARERLADARPWHDLDELLAMARDGEVPGPRDDGRRVPILSPRRLGEPFERLRDRSDAAIRRDGERPAAFLACLDPPAKLTAPLGFTRNLLEAGGFQPIQSQHLASADEAAAAFTDTKARIAGLCATDATLTEAAPPMARALRAAGCQRLIHVGDPGERRASLQEAGFDLFAHSGCDAVELLTALHDALGTPEVP